MTFDFYFAGDQCAEANDMIVKLNANRLLSYVNDKKTIQKYFEYKKCGWVGKLIIDSGAFTAHRKDIDIDIDRYCHWLNMNDKYIDYAIQLDKIPGKWGIPRTVEQIKEAAQESYDNLVYMQSKVKHCNKIIPVFHNTESMNHLARLLELDNLEYICLSGSKDEPGHTMDDWLDRCFDVIKHSKYPNIKVHLLGCSKFRYAEMYPLTSMDATSWIQAGAMGNVITPDGDLYVGNWLVVNSYPKQCLTNLQNYLDTLNIKLEDVVSDYRWRMITNIATVHEQSKHIIRTKNTIRRRKLI